VTSTDVVLGTYNAMNGFQYRVKVANSMENGRTNHTITVDVFKRYNWGNVAGGKHRDNVGPGSPISQNDLAQLHTDGYAQDFNIWGSYTYTMGG
jgi:hypothetical protein